MNKLANAVADAVAKKMDEVAKEVQKKALATGKVLEHLQSPERKTQPPKSPRSGEGRKEIKEEDVREMIRKERAEARKKRTDTQLKKRKEKVRKRRFDPLGVDDLNFDLDELEEGNGGGEKHDE